MFYPVLYFVNVTWERVTFLVQYVFIYTVKFCCDFQHTNFGNLLCVHLLRKEVFPKKHMQPIGGICEVTYESIH